MIVHRRWNKPTAVSPFLLTITCDVVECHSGLPRSASWAKVIDSAPRFSRQGLPIQVFYEFWVQNVLILRICKCSKSKAQTERRSAWKTCFGVTKTQSIASCASCTRSPLMFRNRTASLENLERSWKTLRQACSFFLPSGLCFPAVLRLSILSILSIGASLNHS